MQIHRKLVFLKKTLYLDMIFNTHTPLDPLKKHVDVLMYFKDYMPPHSIERVVPTGHIFVIFELDGYPRNTYNAQTLKPEGTYTEVWVSGMHRNYLSISAHEQSEMFIMQFKTAGFSPFINIDVSELTERVIPANIVFGNEILQLRKLIMAEDNAENKFKVAETWLLNKFNEQNIPSEELYDILKKLQQEPAAGLDKILISYPYTQKHLITQFKKHVGITPKYYQRILRFNEILLRIHNKENIAWSEIAYTCGFSDQSHFIKEFKHFSGFNPVEFIYNDYNKQVVNFFPVK